MTAPSVVSATAYAGPDSDGTSWEILSGVAINKGSILAVSAATGGGTTLSTASTGWAKLGQINDGQGSFRTSSAVFYATRDIASSTFTLSSTGSQRFTAILLKISDGGVVEGTGATDTNDCPNHTLSRARDVLWVGVVSAAEGDVADSAPAGFGGLTTQAGNNDKAGTSLAYRTALADLSENPGTFSMASGGSGKAGAAWTIAAYKNRQRPRGTAII